MSLRTRLSIATAVGLLAAAAAVTPGGSHDGWDPSDGNGSGGDGSSRHDPNGGNGNGNGGNGGNGSGGNGHHGQRLYEGVVTADTLTLRSTPNRGSQITRFAHRGDVVKIFCKTGGETVQGNRSGIC